MRRTQPSEAAQTAAESESEDGTRASPAAASRAPAATLPVASAGNGPTPEPGQGAGAVGWVQVESCRTRRRRRVRPHRTRRCAHGAHATLSHAGAPGGGEKGWRPHLPAIRSLLIRSCTSSGSMSVRRLLLRTGGRARGPWVRWMHVRRGGGATHLVGGSAPGQAIVEVMGRWRRRPGKEASRKLSLCREVGFTFAKPSQAKLSQAKPRQAKTIACPPARVRSLAQEACEAEDLTGHGPFGSVSGDVALLVR